MRPLDCSCNPLDFRAEESNQRRLDCLPSTKFILPRHEPQYSRIITHHFYRQVEFCAVRSSAEYKLFPEQFPQ